MTQTLYRDGALADGRSDRLRVGVSILVEDGRISWIRPSDDEGPTGPLRSVDVVDAGGTTFIPGMVDCHSHLTLPGGSHWIERIDDPVEVLLDVAERNGRLLTAAGVRWARDVGSPRVADPLDGRVRGLALGVRDRWRGRPGLPYVRAAGTWLDRAGTMPGERTVEAEDADELVALAIGQLDDGADLLKLYLDGPDRGVAPWSADEVARVTATAHARGAKVTAHSSDLPGARAGVLGGVDAIEHGDQIDEDLATEMARRGTALVSTLVVYHSWQTFGTTTTIERFTAPDRRTRIVDRLASAEASVRTAHAAGVAIATGTDFGGGSTRANQIAWEVEALVTAGLQPWEALGAATWRGGALLGEPEAGVIREGGPADFALVHGDPTSDPSALWRVWRTAWA